MKSKVSLLFVVAGSFLLLLIFLNLNQFKSSRAENPVSEAESKQVFDFTGSTTGSTEADDKITFSAALNNPYFLSQDVNRNGYLFVSAQAAVYNPENSKRTPLNISIVIDRSGSMSGDKIAYVKKAAAFVVDQLSPEDMVSIVIYDDLIDVLHESGRVEQKDHIIKKINSISSRNMTNLGGGMIEGYNQVKKNFKSGYVNRVLLLSDGLANVGVTDNERLFAIARSKNVEEGISLSTFGVGLDYNEDLMTGLAEYGSGNYYFISNPEDIPGIFAKELQGLLKVVAQNAKLEITLPDGVKLEKVMGQKYEQVGSTVTVFFNNIFSEELKALILQFSIGDNVNDKLTFVSKLTYLDAVSAQMQQKELIVTADLTKTTDKVLYDQHKNRNVEEQVVLFESNYLLEQAMKETDKRNFDKARQFMKQNYDYLQDNDDYVKNSPELQKQSKINSTYEQKIKDAETMNDQEFKRMQKSSKNDNYLLRQKK